MRRWNRFRGPGSVRAARNAAVRRPSIEPEWLTDAVAGRLAVPGLAEARTDEERTDEENVAACAAAARGLAASAGVPLSGSDPRTPADLAKRFYDFSPRVRDYAGAAVEELLEYFPEIEGDIRVDCVKPVTQDLGGGGAARTFSGFWETARGTAGSRCFRGRRQAGAGGRCGTPRFWRGFVSTGRFCIRLFRSSSNTCFGAGRLRRRRGGSRFRPRLWRTRGRRRNCRGKSPGCRGIWLRSWICSRVRRARLRAGGCG